MGRNVCFYFEKSSIYWANVRARKHYSKISFSVCFINTETPANAYFEFNQGFFLIDIVMAISLCFRVSKQTGFLLSYLRYRAAMGGKTARPGSSLDFVK